jgi:hypothetical protein
VSTAWVICSAGNRRGGPALLRRRDDHAEDQPGSDESVAFVEVPQVHAGTNHVHPLLLELPAPFPPLDDGFARKSIAGKKDRHGAAHLSDSFGLARYQLL